MLPGADAMRHAGITPLVLGGKDGLALIAANAVSLGDAALVVARAEQVMVAADVAAAVSLDAIAGNPSILAPVVGRAKPIAGQVAAADHLRDLLEGSEVWEAEGPRSVQDPLSFRVVPQVHGALREYVAAARQAVETELNAAADNPLVAHDDQTLISNGNFHPIVLAIAFDAVRVAIAHVGLLCERRMDHLWTAILEGMTGPPPASLFGVSLRYPAAAARQELRQLAAPATLDVPPLERGVEDHGTGAPCSVRTADRALHVLEHLLAVELLLACDALRVDGAARAFGSGTTAALRAVDDAAGIPDPTPDTVHAALRARLPTSM